MRRMFLVIGLTPLCFTNFASLAQTPTTSGADVSVADICFDVPKLGKIDDYDQGIKRHIAWRKAHHDTWTWQTWEVVTGKDTGSYITATFGHRWEDFDDREEFNAKAHTDFN